MLSNKKLTRKEILDSFVAEIRKEESKKNSPSLRAIREFLKMRDSFMKGY